MKNLEKQLKEIATGLRDLGVPDLMEVLKSGSQFEGGKMRIYALYRTEPDKRKRVKWLKEEYGSGGRTIELRGHGGFVKFSPNGVEIKLFDRDDATTFPWDRAEYAIECLIEEGNYLTTKDMLRYIDIMMRRDDVPYPDPKYKYPPDEEDEE